MAPKQGTKSSSLAAQLGMTFPAGGRMHRFLRRATGGRMRVSPAAGVYLAAVLEYLTAEVAELGGNAAKQAKHKRITPHDVAITCHLDEELKALFRGVHFTGAGLGKPPLELKQRMKSAAEVGAA